MVDKVRKFFDSLDEKMKKRIHDKLTEIKAHPFKASGVKKLQGWGENVYRVRIGKIRVIYKVLENDIEIVDINFRGNIY
ncbi:MAG: type II toxin-antitoxin system RelE/ParE family toxin [Candidatus Peregrinibacteria bacterium]|nr:type II toxin-antitoxin system RelE/ParE family toxin [Candidatus Peregrinibacteria bacterium]